MKLSAVILAGGKSSRMGRDKAWIEHEGSPLIVQTVATVRRAGVEDIFISGRPGVDYSELGLPVIYDRNAGLGPLAGIERGLLQSKSPLLLVLAVDLPHMTPSCLETLASQCDAFTGTGTVPELNGQPEPLAAIYPRHCHALAASLLAQSRLAAREFAEVCRREHAVTFVPIPFAAASVRCFANWNTPFDVISAAPCVQAARPLRLPNA